MRFDQSEAFGAAVLMPAAALDADTTPPEVALGKAQSATILLAVGVGGITFDATNKVEFKLTHAEESGGTFEAVEQADVVGVTVGEGGIVHSLVEEQAAATVTKIGYKGRRGFLKLLPDFSGTHGSPTPMSAVVVTGNLDRIDPA
ncbi:hypothetical protein HKCCE4037_06460 [Rhodobacterales bacterium HKCCE4037]|nr:hypothetical protein [Rhodobacterales bacterium HKCCE4037]